MKRISLFALLFLSLGLAAQDDFAQKMHAYTAQAVQDWQIPGLAITVVKDGEVLFSQGYGVLTLGTTDSVSPQSLFLCASTTKAFTAFGIGLLVDQGKLSWDDRVIDHLPGFQLQDPYVTREVRVRDLLCHRAGLGNADFLWTMQQYDSDEIMRRMRFIPPGYSFRAGYTYQNLMFLVAGQVIEAVSGQPWAAFMREKIYQPLGMNSTYPYLSYVTDLESYSSPHDFIDDSLSVIQHTDADQIGPAGSMWSNVEDMGKWLTFLLDSAKVNGERLLSAASYRELFRPHTLIPYERFYATARLSHPHWTSYGLGWFQHDYHGRQVDFHTGSLAGMVAIAGLIREEGIGVYVMANLDHAEVRHALMYKTFDLLLELGNTDWSQKILEIEQGKKIGRKLADMRLQAQRVPDTRPSLALSEYAGTYTHELWGEAEVVATGDSLILTFSPINVLTATHWHYDTFYGSWKKAWNGQSLLNFHLDAVGKVQSLDIWGRTFTRKNE